MLATPKRPEIDHRTIKLVVGLIALTLAPLTSFLAHSSISSISASYFAGDWPRNIFVGFLFAISAFLTAYNGLSTIQMLLSKVAAFAALGVATFPCNCSNPMEAGPSVHAISATAMFLILTFFCYAFYQHAKGDVHVEAKLRRCIYALCGITIVAAISVLAVDYFLEGSISAKIVRLTFYCESAGLMAFGISWLTASHTLPGITSKTERFSPFSDRVPS
jgi:hypothetical protein